MGKNLNKFRGCLIGGAAGDALGYAVEFMSSEDIFIKYGEKGITAFQLQDGKALISDDTQMTLFTANGLLYASTMQQTGGPFESYPASIALAYRDWLRTQQASQSKGSVSWLNNIPKMNSRRAPGNTCLTALGSGVCGKIAAPVNDSKGCGGIMRVAPIGLYLQSLGFSLYDSDLIAAEAAAVTHGHPLGYMPAAALAQIIGYAVNMPGSPLLYSVMSAKHALGKIFPNDVHLSTMAGLIDKAIELSLMDLDDLDAIRQLGEGWTGEECLAIAIYCSLKYSDNFEEALIASVNHDGNSDSTGAVTGNILGAYLGMDAIPGKFIENLELKDVILEIADDLYNDCPISYDDVMENKVWVSKYIKHDYRPGETLPSEISEKAELAEKENAAAEEQIPPVRDMQMTIDLGLFAPIEEEREQPKVQGKPKPGEKAELKEKHKAKGKAEPKSTPLVLKKAERKEKPTPPPSPAPKKNTKAEPEEKPALRQAAVKPADPGKIKFFKWTDATFGGYDVLAVCDKNAYLNLCFSFEGCPMDALCENGLYYFLVDSDWKEITPLRKTEFLHPDGKPSPQGDELKKYAFNPAAYDYRVYTDKELK